MATGHEAFETDTEIEYLKGLLNNGNDSDQFAVGLRFEARALESPDQNQARSLIELGRQALEYVVAYEDKNVQLPTALGTIAQCYLHHWPVIERLCVDKSIGPLDETAACYEASIRELNRRAGRSRGLMLSKKRMTDQNLIERRGMLAWAFNVGLTFSILEWAQLNDMKDPDWLVTPAFLNTPLPTENEDLTRRPDITIYLQHDKAEPPAPVEQIYVRTSQNSTFTPPDDDSVAVVHVLEDIGLKNEFRFSQVDVIREIATGNRSKLKLRAKNLMYGISTRTVGSIRQQADDPIDK